MQSNSNQSQKTAQKFGTMSGVFIPSVLAILGAVMYLILPKVLGGVGLPKMIGIILLAHSITLATAFSISAIATNINVRGGGLYYLISRSLGRAFGGSMGIQLYLAQTIAAAFYTIAFTKAFHVLLQAFYIDIEEKYLAMGCLLLFAAIAYKGADYVIRIQYLILTTILLSLVTIFLAPNTDAFAANLIGNNGGMLPFWIAFALFFPAVTGIDAGVGMSGDLKNPKVSLVRGTFISIIFTMLIYILLVIKLSYLAEPGELVSNGLIITKLTIFPPLIYCGIMLATISSALSYLLTGPRNLRAMSEDRILPEKMNFLSSKEENNNEPHYALLISLVIGELVIFFGNLDLVSQIVAMFFLNVYGWINGAAFLEKISMNPSYRPSFDAPLLVSLYGMIACYCIMYLFHPFVMLGGILFQVILFIILVKNKSSIKIESVWDGVFFQILKKILHMIQENELYKKNWRPMLVSFSTVEKNKHALLTIIDNINSSRSITKMYILQKGSVDYQVEKRQAIEDKTKEHIKEQNLDIYTRVIITQNYKAAFETIAQSESLGNMPLNTMMIDYNENLPLAEMANIALDQKKNFIIMRNQSGFTNFQKVDVWWSSNKNGNLALILAYLITHSKKWIENNPIINLHYVVGKRDNYASSREKIKRIIDQSRIENIEFNIIKKQEDKLEQEIYKTSSSSDLVIVGLARNSKNRVDKDSINKMRRLTEKHDISLTVCAYEQIDFKVN
jgi:amino acid transporter